MQVEYVMSVLSSLSPQFQDLDVACPEVFVAIAKAKKNEPFDDAFLREFYRLADKTLSPDTWVSRPAKYEGPFRYTLFVSATHATHDEWMLWEPQYHGFEGFRRLGAAAWNALPNGLKQEYRPLHVLGVNWQPWQPEPAWQWLNFVFRQLRGQGTLVRHDRLGDVELLYLTVGVFCACAMVASSIESANDIPGAKPQWDHQRRELRAGEGLVVRFPRHAPAMFGVLDAFQKKGWPTGSIPNPLTHFRIKDAVDALNKKSAVIRLHFTRHAHDTEVAWHITPV
jgi:hypothetical protein